MHTESAIDFATIMLKIHIFYIFSVIYKYVLLFIWELYELPEINLMISPTLLWLTEPTQMQTPACIWGRTIPCASTDLGLGNSFAEKDLDVLSDTRLNINHQAPLQQRRLNHILGCIRRNIAIRTRELIISQCSAPPCITLGNTKA